MWGGGYSKTSLSLEVHNKFASSFEEVCRKFVISIVSNIRCSQEVDRNFERSKVDCKKFVKSLQEVSKILARS